MIDAMTSVRGRGRHLLVNVRTEREVIDEHNGRLTDGIKEAVVEKVSVDKLEFVMLLAVPPHPAPKLALHDLKEGRIAFKVVHLAYHMQCSRKTIQIARD